MALSIMVKFTKPGRLIAQTSYLGRFKPLKKFGKSFLKSVKVYRRILDLAHCAPWRDEFKRGGEERERSGAVSPNFFDGKFCQVNFAKNTQLNSHIKLKTLNDAEAI